MTTVFGQESKQEKSILQLNKKAPSNNPLKINDVADAGQSIDRLLTQIVRDNIPHTFTETKDWGGQEERWDGIEFRREGLKLETKRRKKLVNHGTWKKYSASLLNPDQEFSVQLKNMRQLSDDKMAFDIHFTAHLAVDGRQSKWVKGVQLYSLSARGHAKVRMKVSIELNVKMDVAKFPPDMIFEPTATKADLEIDEFRIDRVSKAGGEFAQQVSKGVRRKLDEKVSEKEVKLVKKINDQLAKKKDDLRLSFADAMKSKWAESAKPFLPKSVQSAIKD
jgi:hypothetical protein